jgi:hypothetical protein
VKRNSLRERVCCVVAKREIPYSGTTTTTSDGTTTGDTITYINSNLVQAVRVCMCVRACSTHLSPACSSWAITSIALTAPVPSSRMMAAQALLDRTGKCSVLLCVCACMCVYVIVNK